MSQSSDSSDQDIPVLTDVMDTGHDSRAKTKRAKRHGHESSHARRHDAAQAHQETRREAHEEEGHEAARDAHDHAHEDDVPVLDSVYEPERDETHAPAREPAQFVPGEAEFTSGSTAERYVAPTEVSAASSPTQHADASAVTPEYDADVLAERLRGRFATYLKGEGRNLIEARCRDAFQDHTTWLVNQITREVALALETEMLRWVREAIREELGNSADSK